MRECLSSKKEKRKNSNELVNFGEEKPLEHYN